MKKSISALACIVTVFSATTVGAGHQSKTNQPAQARPDLSGKWTLDLGNSKLGQLTVQIFRTARLKLTATLGVRDVLSTPLLPGFRCSVKEIFQ